MKTFSALLLKDLRAVRGWIAVTWLLAIALLLCPQRGALQQDPLGWLSAASQLAAWSWLVLIFMQRSLLGLDPPSGDTRFIATRPVWGSAIFGSKLLVLLFTGVLPLALAPALHLWSAGLGATFGDGLLLAAENGLFMVCLLGFLALRHVLPGHSRWAAGVGIFAALYLLVQGMLILEFQPRSLFESFDPIVPSAFAAGFACWGILAGRYARSWNGWLRWGLALVMGAGMAFASFAWLHDYHLRSSDVPADVHPVFEPQNNAWNCTIRSQADSEMLQNQKDGSFKVIAKNRSVWLEITRDVRIKNLPPAVWLEQTSSEGTLRLEADHIDRPFHQDTRGTESWNVPPQAAAGALPGSPSLLTPWDGRSLTVAEMFLPSVQRDIAFKASFHGRYYFDVYRAELVTQLPIQQGLVWTRRHVRLEFVEMLAHSRQQARLRVLGDVFCSRSSAVDRHKLSTGADEFGFYGINTQVHGLFLMGGADVAQVTSVWQRRVQTLENWGFGMGGYRWASAREAAASNDCVEEDERLDHQQTQIGIFRRVKIGSLVIPFDYENQLLLPRAY